jgi:hypothetical protein
MAAGCGGGTPRSSAPGEGGPSVSVPPGAEAGVAAARADAATRTGVPAQSWQVSELRAVDWPDASLGCPEQGVMYIQVITPGYSFKLAAQGRKLSYHSGGGRVVLCDRSPPTAT